MQNLCLVWLTPFGSFFWIQGVIWKTVWFSSFLITEWGRGKFGILSSGNSRNDSPTFSLLSLKVINIFTLLLCNCSRKRGVFNSLILSKSHLCGTFLIRHPESVPDGLTLTKFFFFKWLMSTKHCASCIADVLLPRCEFEIRSSCSYFSPQKSTPLQQMTADDRWPHLCKNR